MNLKKRQLDIIDEGIREFRQANELIIVAREKESIYCKTSFLLQYCDRKTKDKLLKEKEKTEEQLNFDLNIMFSTAKGNYARGIDKIIKALNKCYLFKTDEEVKGHSIHLFVESLLDNALPKYKDLESISDTLYQLTASKTKKIIYTTINFTDYTGDREINTKDLEILSNIAEELSNYCLSHHMSYPDEFISYMKTLPEPNQDNQ